MSAVQVEGVVAGTALPGSARNGSRLVQRIKDEFARCGGSPVDPITTKELARRWQALAEEEQWLRGFGPLNDQDKRVIALRVAQLMNNMGIRREGRVSLGEWVHHLLLIESGCAQLQINSLLKLAMRKHPRILEELQQMFDVADTGKCGSLSFRQISEMYSHKLWHVRAGKDGKPLTDDELAAGDPEEFAREIIGAMDIKGDDRVTYAEFMAYCLGRRKEEVLIHLYDLSNGVGEKLSPLLLGLQIEGVWHTGVVCFGREYFFSRDTVYDTPGETSFGKPQKVISVGHTLWRQEELHSHIVEDLKPVFHRETYDAIDCNCNHFAQRILDYLNGSVLPEEVLRQPEFLKNAAWVRVMRPIMNWYMRDGIVARDQETAKGVEKPSDLQRRLGADCATLHPGSVVKVEPPGGGPVTWGMVSSPEGRPEGNHDNRQFGNTVREGSIGTATSIFSCGCRCSDLAPFVPSEVLVCVRYFALNLADPLARSPGRLVTEMVPRARLTPIRLEEVGEKAYNVALHAMGNTMPSASSSSLRYKEDANGKPRLSRSQQSSEARAVEERAVEELIAIGFEAKQAEAALESTDWRVDEAVALLMEQRRKQPDIANKTT